MRGEGEIFATVVPRRAGLQIRSADLGGSDPADHELAHDRDRRSRGRSPHTFMVPAPSRKRVPGTPILGARSGPPWGGVRGTLNKCIILSGFRAEYVGLPAPFLGVFCPKTAFLSGKTLFNGVFRAGEGPQKSRQTFR